MEKTGKDIHKKSQPPESFAEHINTLIQELQLAIQWQRPSILLVSCESEIIQNKVELTLEKQLSEIGQGVVKIKVSEKQFDVPLRLARRRDREHSVYSVTGLSKGGGKEGANAYRALNIRREYFVDYQIRAVFWLESEELIALTRHAPDFWAFRHRVVEFGNSPKPKK